MDKYVWMFPVLFIFHDMEEIIGLTKWYEINKKFLEKKFPSVYEMSKKHTTEGMAVAVFEELIFCIAVCIMSIILKWYGLWLGIFIAYIIHLIIHMGQSIIIRKYIPALATSIICLFPGIFVANNSISILQYEWKYVCIFSIIGILIVFVNLRFAHFLMYKFNEWMKNV